MFVSFCKNLYECVSRIYGSGQPDDDDSSDRPAPPTLAIDDRRHDDGSVEIDRDGNHAEDIRRHEDHLQVGNHLAVERVERVDRLQLALYRVLEEDDADDEIGTGERRDVEVRQCRRVFSKLELADDDEGIAEDDHHEEDAVKDKINKHSVCIRVRSCSAGLGLCVFASVSLLCFTFGECK